MSRTATTSSRPTVYIVDDDDDSRNLLAAMVQTVGIEAQTFASAEALLADIDSILVRPACMVLDVRLLGMSGLGLQKALIARGIDVPVILVTAYAGVSTAVQAMRVGAFDFLEKPLHRQHFLERIQLALDADAENCRRLVAEHHVESRFEELSQRERDIARLLVEGCNPKQIAAALGIGVQTVYKHRSSLFSKLKVESPAELVSLYYEAHGNVGALAGPGKVDQPI